MKARVNKKKPRTVYQFKKGNMTQLKSEIMNFKNTFLQNYKNSTIEQNWKEFKTSITEIINKNIPRKTMSDRHDVPWVTKDIKRRIRQKQRLYNKAKKSKNDGDWARFKMARRCIKQDIKTAHDQYLCNILNISEPTNHNKIWSYVKKQRKDSVGIPPLKENDRLVSDSHSKASILNRQYQSVFTKENLKDMPNKGESPFPLMQELLITKEGVIKLLKGINASKACGPDLIPSRILKEGAEEIGEILQAIFQQSIDTGSVPYDWRTANISAIYKKGDKSKAANYRPVSLTSVTCKILEHIIFTNIMKHLQEQNILVHFQHGFRSGHSCESQLVITVDDLAKTIDEKGQSDLLILDFSKAFDTVPHQRLLHKLSYYGIGGSTHNWISSWLTQRTQKVVIDGESSEEVTVDSGVPQGTVLGPLMFLIYINDIADDISSSIRLFADDCLLYRPIRSHDDVKLLQADLSKLISWSKTWQMAFNASKCYVLRVTKRKLPIIYDYTVNNTVLNSVPHSAYLGVELSEDLSWKVHIDNIEKKANTVLGFVKRNFYRASEEVKQLLYLSLVRPHLEYASAVWDPHHSVQISKLEKTQNRAARFVKRDYRTTSSVTSMKNSLGWDTLASRRTKKRLSLFFKAVNGHISIPLSSYPKVIDPYPTRSNRLKYTVPRCRTDTLRYSFYPRTITEWNSLPDSIVNAESVEKFCASLNLKLPG